MSEKRHHLGGTPHSLFPVLVSPADGPTHHRAGVDVIQGRAAQQSRRWPSGWRGQLMLADCPELNRGGASW